MRVEVGSLVKGQRKKRYWQITLKVDFIEPEAGLRLIP
jgi:hypothetical protein